MPFTIKLNEQRHVVEAFQVIITVVKTPVDDLGDEFRIHSGRCGKRPWKGEIEMSRVAYTSVKVRYLVLR